MIFRTISFNTLFLLAIVIASHPVNAQLLDEEALKSADAQQLLQEVTVFTTIQKGISLSVAECTLSTECTANVNRSEMEQLISLIDDRVNTLSLRYSDSGDTSLEPVLVGYADVRDSYKVTLEKMNSLPQFAQKDEVVDELGGDEFLSAAKSSRNALPENLMKLFQDVDEEIVDDAVDDATAPEETP